MSNDLGVDTPSGKIIERLTAELGCADDQIAERDVALAEKDKRIEELERLAANCEMFHTQTQTGASERLHLYQENNRFRQRIEELEQINEGLANAINTAIVTLVANGKPTDVVEYFRRVIDGEE